MEKRDREKGPETEKHRGKGFWIELKEMEGDGNRETVRNEEIVIERQEESGRETE